jgi:5,6-dimethylbenzimidazole synthase
MSRFNPTQIDTLYEVIAARRDMRHFRSDPLDEALMTRLLEAAHCAPSVGYMQPWRFIRVKSVEVREKMLALVEAERIETATALGERQQEFLRLKVEGMRECAEILVAALCDKREQHVFGRRTMPDMDLASVACAIQNMWLAARVEDVGMGWISMFDPEALRGLLQMPPGSCPVAILCLGRVDAFYPGPMLESQQWRTRADLASLVFHDRWGNDVDASAE